MSTDAARDEMATWRMDFDERVVCLRACRSVEARSKGMDVGEALHFDDHVIGASWRASLGAGEKVSLFAHSLWAALCAHCGLRCLFGRPQAISHTP